MEFGYTEEQKIMLALTGKIDRYFVDEYWQSMFSTLAIRSIRR